MGEYSSDIEEAESRKKAVFDNMSPRRQKHILKKGFDKWDPFQVPKDPIVRRQTGYQLFVHENKNCDEVIALKAGPLRFKKLGAMWQALKDVPTEGQAYWNEKAKAL